jgi:4-hydroxy-3-polyprenylbenzoate decarboxylase
MKVFVGITGASGTIYGVRLAEELLKLGHSVALCFSKAGKLVASEEIGIPLSEFFHDELIQKFFSHVNTDLLKIFNDYELNSQLASGSSTIDACVVCPCSVSSLSHIAYGTARNLIHRCADVSLKEKKKLVLVVRETPLSLIHIKAMYEAASAGAVILPASPGFYGNPKTLDDIINFVVGKVLAVLGLKSDLTTRYRKEDF